MAVAASAIAACQGSSTDTPPSGAELPGTVELNQGPPNDVAMGGGGAGTLFAFGKLYRFAIGGEGVNGDAIAILQTTGEAYRLHDISGFAGRYRRAPAGVNGGGTQAAGLWLQNEHATLIHLLPPLGGRMPAIGDDAVLIDLR
jgi:hypothetical protein